MNKKTILIGTLIILVCALLPFFLFPPAPGLNPVDTEGQTAGVTDGAKRTTPTAPGERDAPAFISVTAINRDGEPVLVSRYSLGEGAGIDIKEPTSEIRLSSSGLAGERRLSIVVEGGALYDYELPQRLNHETRLYVPAIHTIVCVLANLPEGAEAALDYSWAPDNGVQESLGPVLTPRSERSGFEGRPLPSRKALFEAYEGVATLTPETTEGAFYPPVASRALVSDATFSFDYNQGASLTIRANEHSDPVDSLSQDLRLIYKNTQQVFAASSSNPLQFNHLPFGDYELKLADRLLAFPLSPPGFFASEQGLTSFKLTQYEVDSVFQIHSLTPTRFVSPDSSPKSVQIAHRDFSMPNSSLFAYYSSRIMIFGVDFIDRTESDVYYLLPGDYEAILMTLRRYDDKEIESPTNIKYSFTIPRQESTHTVNIQFPEKGSLLITANNEAIDQYSVKIIDPEKSGFAQTFTIERMNKDRCEIDNIPVGRYFAEISDMRRQRVLRTPPFDIQADMTTELKVSTGVDYSATLELTALNNEGDPIRESNISLYGQGLVLNSKTDGDGVAVFPRPEKLSGAVNVTVYPKDTSIHPHGYITEEIEIDSDSETVIFDNLCKVIIKTVDASTGSPVAGLHFQVFALPDGNNSIGYAGPSNQDGVVVIDSFIQTEAQVKATNMTEAGYVNSKIDIKAGQEYTVEFITEKNEIEFVDNRLNPVSDVVLFKPYKAANNNRMYHAHEFQLSDLNTGINQIGVSDIEGKIEFKRSPIEQEPALFYHNDYGLGWVDNINSSSSRIVLQPPARIVAIDPEDESPSYFHIRIPFSSAEHSWTLFISDNTDVEIMLQPQTYKCAFFQTIASVGNIPFEEIVTPIELGIGQSVSLNRKALSFEEQSTR